jgi:hypothetical protein
MEFRPLAELLEDLLLSAGDVDAEIHLATAVAQEIEEFVGLREEYEQRYARAVAGVRDLRGNPTFVGSASDPGFPSGLGADLVSCWSGPHGMIYLAIKVRPDGFLLFGGARAQPATRRELKTIQPPPG